jgi:hypothetical protein
MKETPRLVLWLLFGSMLTNSIFSARRLVMSEPGDRGVGDAVMLVATALLTTLAAGLLIRSWMEGRKSDDES